MDKLDEETMARVMKKCYFMRPDLVMPGIMEKNNVLTNVKTMKVRDDDVYLVTYPKAGTNWACEILDAMLNIDNLEVLKTRSLFEKIPILEFGPSIHPDLVEDGIEHLPSNVKAVIDPMPSPRRIPTHLLPEYMPEEWHQKKPKTIVCDRNPKDCLISLLGWHRSTRFLSPLEWNELFEAYMQGLTVYGPYPDFTKAWAKYENEPWLMWIRYEDLRLNPKESFRKVAEFLGKDLTAEQIDQVIHVTSFDYMKKAMETVKDRDIFLNKKGVWQRKGVVGNWKEAFTISQNETFNKHYKEGMKGYEHLMYDC
ncbi:sulfotransferase 1B1-like [Ptychodera flava]|uniref:sulfotransferase 1B1-like n=1 Tax=Ptychodera flava TaxID=63121 RepID=UPI003969BC93